MRGAGRARRTEREGMSYYKTCPDCGAHLDPGEECDCRKTVKVVCGATCDMFSQRVDVGGESFIACMSADGAVSISIHYDSRQERDEAYGRRCCLEPGSCPYYAQLRDAPRIGETGSRAEALVEQQRAILRGCGL